MSEPSGPANGPREQDGRTPTPIGGVSALRGSDTHTGFHPVQVRHREHAPTNPTGSRLAVLSLAALGVVYGDIGTSPLSQIHAAFNNEKGHGFPVTEAAVYGVLSMIVWSLILVVAVKYIYFIMRAD